jgi:CRP/FNR family cyclic AMP-dependent transcriptional regulator
VSLPDRKVTPFSDPYGTTGSHLRTVQPQEGAASPAKTLRVRKSELLFREGEGSRAMYYLKTGIIRIFKAKSDGVIEIDTIRAGQILGELAFLDGLPRSASAEALTECELVEVSSQTFTSVVSSMPDWLKLLLKTVVGRLRTASTRIKQLEMASTSFETDREGKRVAQYTYLNPYDVMKICTALLVAGARYGRPVEGVPRALEFKFATLDRFGNQIMGVPSAKVQSLVELFATVDLTQSAPDDKVRILDLDFLDQLTSYLNQENLLEPAKRHDVTARGFLILGLMVKHLRAFPADATTGKSKINLAKIIADEKGDLGRDPFRLDEFPELVKLGYCTEMQLKSGSEVYTQVTPAELLKSYRIQRIVQAVRALNDEKRIQATSASARRR